MIWYCVISKFDDSDVVAAVTGTIEASNKPENGVELHDGKQIWVDWFESLEEAELFMRAVLEE